MSNLMPYRYSRYPMNRQNFDVLTDAFFRPFFRDMGQYSGNIRIDVSDKGDHYLLEADLPGVMRDQLNINVEDDVLTISAEMNGSKKEEKDNYVYSERRFGKYQRSFTLNGIDQENITANYTDGVLQLNLPKQAEQPKTGRKIDINFN